jgi:hypothetical protein
MVFAGSTEGRANTLAAGGKYTPPDLKLVGDPLDTQKFKVESVSYEKLLKLPQVEYRVSDDSNFTRAVRLGGVDLDVLLRSLAIDGRGVMIAADCDDGYEAHYTAEYRAAHHPFLVLTIDGRAPAELPRASDGGSYGPYLISHERFVPGFRILAHEEEAQIPNGVVELHFLPEKEVLRALLPPGENAPSAVIKGTSTIALQNCLRCHNRGRFGGSKAGIDWQQMGAKARRDPQYFAAYIRDPQSVNPYAQMPGNSAYDAQTLQALTMYFQSFASSGKP